MSVSMQGTAKFFDRNKHYGFIRGDDQQDYFVHVSAMNRAKLDTLVEGQRMSFTVEPGKGGKGPRAMDLKVL